MHTLYEVKWTEYERGWGFRPDGETYYLSKELAEKAIKDYWDSMPNDVPDCYSKPSQPTLVEVSEELYKSVAKEPIMEESNMEDPKNILMIRITHEGDDGLAIDCKGSPNLVLGMIARVRMELGIIENRVYEDLSKGN